MEKISRLLTMIFNIAAQLVIKRFREEYD